MVYIIQTKKIKICVNIVNIKNSEKNEKFNKAFNNECFTEYCNGSKY